MHGLLRLLAVISVIVAGSGGMSAAEVPLGNPKIIYAHVSSSAGRLDTILGKVLLEKLGYQVDLKMLDVGLAYEALASGKAELFSTAWLPGHQPYFTKLGNKLDIIANSYGPVPGGFMVPGYVAVKSIEDLKSGENKTLFKGKIIGSAAGAGIVASANKVVKDYGLDFEVVPTSDATMSAAFKAAYEKKEPIVITGWCPHFLCALFDVKFLDDPKQIFGDASDFHVARAGFRTDYPRATAFLSRYTLFASQMSTMFLWMEVDKLTVDQAVQRFMEKNPELIWYWIGDLTPGQKKPSSLQ